MPSIEGRHYQTGQPIAIDVAEGRIAAVRPSTRGNGPWWIAPGFVDAQVNGYRGIDFNALSLNQVQIEEAVNALWQDGVTSFMPTIITHGEDEMIVLSRRWAGLKDRSRLFESVIGLHWEGPFISLEDGPRGAHPKAGVRSPDLELVMQGQRASEDLIRLVTLSPEWQEAPSLTRALVQLGIRVAIGHTAANSAEIAAVVDAGATLSTHLGNGSHPYLPRHTNYIWDQLAEDRLWASVIGDGHHLPWPMLKVLLRAKAKTAYFVSDATSLAGCPPGSYAAPVGGKVQLNADGRLFLADHPEILAGSAMPLKDAVFRMAAHGMGSLAALWDLTSIRPAKFWNLEAAGGLAVGAPADLVCFKLDANALIIGKTMKCGTVVYQREEG